MNIINIIKAPLAMLAVAAIAAAGIAIAVATMPGGAGTAYAQDPTPDPAAPAAPTPTPVVIVVTATPVPAAATPEPTPTPVPTWTPEPTWTPVPTNTPLPTNSPVPTNTPPPTFTPVPVQQRTAPGGAIFINCGPGEPCVKLHSTHTSVTVDEKAVLSFSIVNSLDKPNMLSRLILELPSGWSMDGEGFADKCSGLCSANYTIATGGQELVEVTAYPNHSGKFRLAGRVEWVYEGTDQILHSTHDVPITVSAGAGGNESRVQPLPTSPPQPPTAAPAAPAAPAAAAPTAVPQQAPAQPAAAAPTPAAGVAVTGGCFAPTPAYGSDGEMIFAKQPLDFAAIMFGGLLVGVVGLVAFRRRFHKA